MPHRTSSHVVIDARPRGPRGLLAGELILGRSVLLHLLDLAGSPADQPVVIHARLDDHRHLEAMLGVVPPGSLAFATGPPPEDSIVLRTDRLYDPSRLRRALRKGRDPESAVLWRLDSPQGLSGAEAELTRRHTYQPLGRYWALGPARWLARRLQPTRIGPNALTLTSAALMLTASAIVAFVPRSQAVSIAVGVALALSLVLDTADGHLARLQGSASEFGRWLDAYLDELADMAFHAAIAWSAFAANGSASWLLLGMLYGMGKYLFVAGTAGAERAESGPGSAVSGASAPWYARVARNGGAAGDRSRILESRGAHSLVTALKRVVRLAGHADVRWHLWIVLAVLGRLELALAAYAVYFPSRSLAGAIRRGVRHA